MPLDVKTVTPGQAIMVSAADKPPVIQPGDLHRSGKARVGYGADGKEKGKREGQREEEGAAPKSEGAAAPAKEETAAPAK